jgi:hypothetical protein
MLFCAFFTINIIIRRLVVPPKTQRRDAAFISHDIHHLWTIRCNLNCLAWIIGFIDLK